MANKKCVYKTGFLVTLVKAVAIFRVVLLRSSTMAEYTFNINCGYLEGLVRGFKGGILRQADYLNLVQCDTLEGLSSRFPPVTVSVVAVRIVQSVSVSPGCHCRVTAFHC